jgi:hypothetical protein
MIPTLGITKKERNIRLALVYVRSKAALDENAGFLVRGLHLKVLEQAWKNLFQAGDGWKAPVQETLDVLHTVMRGLPPARLFCNQWRLDKRLKKIRGEAALKKDLILFFRRKHIEVIENPWKNLVQIMKPRQSIFCKRLD